MGLMDHLSIFVQPIQNLELQEREEIYYAIGHGNWRVVAVKHYISKQNNFIFEVVFQTVFYIIF